ncbi:MAG: cytochrome c maturation protein CcmE [Acidimicrobiia bacterium]
MPYRRFVFPALAAMAVGVGLLVWTGIGDNLVYYLTPSEATERRGELDDGERFRLGGLVVPGSVAQVEGGVEFRVSDGGATITVVHTGTPPQLFQGDIEVLVEGAFLGNEFQSDRMFVKHDENYRAPEEGNYPPDPEAAPLHPPTQGSHVAPASLTAHGITRMTGTASR